MLIKLNEIIYDSSGEVIMREIFVKRESIILVTDDLQMTTKINEALKRKGAVSRVVVNLSGSHRDVFTLGTASEVRAKISNSSRKGILHG